jgi:GDP-4-dehydro-6-deoxy-D-mannose reductase
LRALITGVSGFVGSHLAECLLAETDWEISGTVYGPYDNISHVCERLRLYPAELSRLPVVEFVLEQTQPDVIFHLAAMAVTGNSWRDPAATIQINMAMQANVLQAVVNLKLDSRVIVVGSSEEYGAVPENALPVDESAPFRPLNPYAVSKVGQDMLGLQYYLSHGIDTVRVRPFNHIGPRQRLGFVVSDFASQIAQIEAGQADGMTPLSQARSAAHPQEPIMRVGHLGAERDFTDVRDVVRAYHLLVLHGEAGEVYNIGSGHSHAVREVLDTLLQQSGVDIRVEPDPARMRPSDIPRVVCDYHKLHERTGWEPRISFEQSLADVLAYWRAQVSRTG